MSTPKTRQTSQEASPQAAAAPTKFILIHGDKGGVGKSFVAQAMADYLMTRGEKVAVIDADTANPDVARMFANHIPTAEANVRSENGWMDVMDFVIKHLGHTIIMNTPAGIGEFMKHDMESFTAFLRDQETPVELELWWTLNVQHDSVNLLAKANEAYGQYFQRIRVVCNLHFAGGNKNADGPFLLWNESPLRTRIEKANGMTIYFPGLHVRVVQKVFAPDQIMPFALAQDASTGEAVALEHSERWKLTQWRSEIKKLMDPAFPASAAPALVAA